MSHGLQGDARPEFAHGVCLDEDHQYCGPGWPESEAGKTQHTLKQLHKCEELITDVKVERCR